MARSSTASRRDPFLPRAVSASFDTLPLADARFDVVVFNASLHYACDLAATLHEARRVTRSGGRVVILGAGRATLELANPAQVAYIDQVETDGGTSDPIRLGIEVDDTAAVVARSTAGGARVEAQAHVTPWRSLNARLRGPAGLQLTVFQELGPV